MDVVFDSNVWERVVHLDAEPFDTIRRKIRSAHIAPYICEVAISLESIRKVDRSGFFETYSPNIEFQTLPSNNNETHGLVCFSPNNEAHPPLSKVLLARLEQAHQLGFKVIHMNRFGTVRTNEIPKDMYMEVGSMEEFWADADRFAECAGFIEMLSAGQYEYNKLVNSLNLRRLSLIEVARKIPREKHKAFSNAIAEWVDGDSLAACYSKGFKYFCTADRGKNSGPSSIFSANKIARLSVQFPIEIISSEMAAAAF